MRILIGCPVIDIKGDLTTWKKSIDGLTDKNEKDIFLVDNSDTIAFNDALTVDSLHLVNMAGKSAEVRISASMEEIRKRVLSGGYDWYFSVEQDNIIPPETLDYFLPRFEDFDIITHSYPDRTNPSVSIIAMGCTLIKAAVFQDYEYTDQFGYCDIDNPTCYHGVEGALFAYAKKQGFKFAAIDNVLLIGHS